MAVIPEDIQQGIRRRMRHIMALQGLTQAKFAERLGISSANMSKHLSGKLPVTPGLVNRICLDYGVARQWLMYGHDMPYAKSEGDNLRNTAGRISRNGAPVYDIDVTAGFGPLNRMFTEDRITGHIDLPQLNNPRNERIVRVSGNSMEPAICHGSYIAIREVQTDTIYWGQAYVIILEDYRMVKILRKHPDASMVVLHSENPNYDDIEVSRNSIVGLYMVDAIINFTTTK